MKNTETLSQSLQKLSIEEEMNVSLRQEDIPDFLRDSAFFRSLDWSDEGAVVSVPKHCFKADTSITCSADAVDLLETVRFWGAKMPRGALEWLYGQGKDNKISLLIRFRELKILEILQAKTGKESEFMLYSVKINDMHLAGELLEVGYHFTERCVEAAADNGSVEFIELMQSSCTIVEQVISSQQGDTVKCSLCDRAATRGNIELVKLFHHLGSRLTKRGLLSAAHNGHWEAVRVGLLDSNWTHYCRGRLLQIATQQDDTLCLDLMIGWEDFDEFELTWEYAVTENSLKCMQMLYDAGKFADLISFENCRHMQSFEFLVEHSTHLDPDEQLQLPNFNGPSTDTCYFIDNYLHKYPDCDERTKNMLEKLRKFCRSYDWENKNWNEIGYYLD